MKCTGYSYILTPLLSHTSLLSPISPSNPSLSLSLDWSIDRILLHIWFRSNPNPNPNLLSRVSILGGRGRAWWIPAGAWISRRRWQWIFRRRPRRRRRRRRRSRRRCRGGSGGGSSRRGVAPLRASKRSRPSSGKQIFGDRYNLALISPHCAKCLALDFKLIEVIWFSESDSILVLQVMWLQFNFLELWVVQI